MPIIKCPVCGKITPSESNLCKSCGKPWDEIDSTKETSSSLSPPPPKTIEKTGHSTINTWDWSTAQKARVRLASHTPPTHSNTKEHSPRSKNPELWDQYNKLLDQAEKNPKDIQALIALGDNCLERKLKVDAMYYFKQALSAERGNLHVLKRLRENLTSAEMKELNLLDRELQLLSHRPTEEEPFDQIIFNSLRYPLLSRTASIVLCGSLFLETARLVPSFVFRNPLYNLLTELSLIFLFLLFFVPYCLSIIRKTTVGNNIPPYWPNTFDFQQDIGIPFLQTFPLLVGPLLLGFLVPGMRYLIYMISFLYLPLFLIHLSLSHKFLESLNPKVILPPLKIIHNQYFFTVTLLGICFLLSHFATSRMPPSLSLFSHALKIYLCMLSMRILGMFYRMNANDIRWLSS